MLLIAFIAFAILIVAWLAAPNGETAVSAKPGLAAPAPSLQVGEAIA